MSTPPIWQGPKGTIRRTGRPRDDGYVAVVTTGRRKISRYFARSEYRMLAMAKLAARAWLHDHGVSLGRRAPLGNAGLPRTGPGRGTSGVLGVQGTARGWSACWNDPPGKRNVVYCGAGPAGHAKAKALRAAKERLLRAKYAKRVREEARRARAAHRRLPP